MLVSLVRLVVTGVELYAVFGLLFALAFLPQAVTRMDPGVTGAPLMMRLLIFPGVAALWPLFAWRWLTGAHAPTERNPHRDQATASDSAPSSRPR